MIDILPHDAFSGSDDGAAGCLRQAHIARLRGEPAEAERWLARAVAAGGHAAPVWNNLGAALASQGRYEEALAAWRHGHDVVPTDRLIARNLALALGRAGDAEAGLALLEPLIAAAPGDTALRLALGRLLFQAGDARAGVDCVRAAIGADAAAVEREFPTHGPLRVARRPETTGAPEETEEQRTEREIARWTETVEVAKRISEETLLKAIEAKPDDDDAYLRLVSLYQESDRAADSARVLRDLLARVPDHPIALHKLDVITGTINEPRVPNGYITMLFDRFSVNFDEVLARLGYAAPAFAADILGRLAPLATPGEVLDMGCGTGLCGSLLRPMARRLTGLDLSAGMLAKARLRGTYDELVEAEITQHLATTERRYDAVVSADVLCYFGRLEPVFAGVAGALAPGGRFVCTLERLMEAESDADVLIRHHGRYSHREAHVRASLAAAGLDPVAIEYQVLRKEMGDPVHGLVVLARKPGNRI